MNYNPTKTLNTWIIPADDPERALDENRAYQLTLFTIPKPFVGDAKTIQLNAIRSWIRFGRNLQIVLLGDDPGVADAASELGLEHVPKLERNEYGTPLLSSAFQAAHSVASSPMLMYCNCDVILLDDFFEFLNQFRRLRPNKFLAIGRRTDLPVPEEIDYGQAEQIQRLKSRCRQEGKLNSIVCKEYFIFSESLFQSIPDFAVGRGNWDNWMVRTAKQDGVPVIGLSEKAVAIHQTHDYHHLNTQATGRQRWHCYVSGAEAKRNQQLAGGQHLITGSTSDWRFDGQKLIKRPLASLNLEFWRDLPRFAGLVSSLFSSSRS